MEAAHIDEIVDHIQDMNQAARPAFFEKDEEKKKELYDKFEKEVLPVKLEQLEKRMAGLGGEYLATKDTVSWADFHFMQTVLVLRKRFPNVLDNFATLAGLVDRVTELPKMKKYLAERPESNI